MKKEKTKELVERPNKSQIKRDMQILFEQTVYICDLKAEKIKRFNLHPAILDAIEELKRIKTITARKRHLQFITRLLSEQNNLDEIEHIIYEYQNPHFLQQQIDRRIDRIIGQLLDGEQNAIDELFHNSPNLDRQNFLQILRNAQKEYQQIKKDEAKLIEQDELVLKAPDGKQTKKLKKILRDLLKTNTQNNKDSET